MPETTSTYLMEDAREARRLAEKVQPMEWISRYLRTYVQEPQRMLDVGCGPGVIVQALAEAYPESEVCGLDASADRLAEGQRRCEHIPNVRWCQSNAMSMVLPSASFDLVFSRFLFEYLPHRDQALQEMIRVCRPGGLIVLQDLDGQLMWHDPPDEELDHVLQGIRVHLENAGFDPFVGRKLYALAYAAGLQDIMVQAESYHLIPGRIDDENYRLWELKLDIALPVITQAVGSVDMAQRVKQQFLNYLLRKDTLTYSVVFTVTGRKAAP